LPIDYGTDRASRRDDAGSGDNRSRADGRRPASGRVSGPSPGTQCRAVIEPADGGRDCCTLYSTASGDSLITTWISAAAGAYVDLEDVR